MMSSNLHNKLLLPDGGQGNRKSGHLCLVLIRRDRHNTDSFFENRDRIETEKIRADTGQKTLIESGQQAGFSRKSGQKRDKDRTWTVSSADNNP